MGFFQKVGDDCPSPKKIATKKTMGEIDKTKVLSSPGYYRSVPPSTNEPTQNKIQKKLQPTKSWSAIWVRLIEGGMGNILAMDTPFSL